MAVDAGQVERDVSLQPYAMPVSHVLQSLTVDVRNGLEDEEAAKRRLTHGANELIQAPPEPVWKRLFKHFNEVVIWILVAASSIAALMGEWVDALAILAIVILNGLIGFFQEEKAGRAMSELRKMSTPATRVLRKGVLRALAARELVPGDIIVLEAGDHIPADSRLIETHGFHVQEAALTGESSAVTKDAHALFAAPTSLGDRGNMAFLGTVAASGQARAVVTATGMATELGRIAGLLQRQPTEPTPLQRRLTELGKVLIVICLTVVAVVFVLQILRGGAWVEVLLVSVSLAVAAVPEGLPAVVTIALALGLQRMVRRNVLIRKLPSVETLGSVTVICTDKTGTLTRNEMTVTRVVTPSSQYRVTGTGYDPQGSFLRTEDDGTEREVDPASDAELIQTLTVAALCNNASVSPADGDPVATSWRVTGDPTEGALLVAAMKAHLSREDAGLPIEVLPFESQRRAMSAVFQTPRGAVIYTKGGPEAVVPMCVAEQLGSQIVPLTDERRAEILQASSKMAGEALRVIAMAHRLHPHTHEGRYLESGLVFCGMVGMIDPPREEVATAILRCRSAGIRPIMITGDHPATALAIARELGLVAEHDRALTGVELDAMSDEELAAQADRVPVYARVSAEHKMRVIAIWKRRGHVVAMTGDGVNDAPAIKAADIGIAMGITGTDVTKEASDMVLLDDNFVSIVNAVEEGRGIYDNIQKVLVYLLSCNFGEILLMLGASLLGWPVPLTPLQLLWINLVTDGLPALALAMEKPEPGVMQRPPRPADQSILTPGIGRWIVGQGLLVCIVGLTAFGISYVYFQDGVEHARGIAFCVVVYDELLRSFAARSRRFTLGQLGLTSNLYLLAAVLVSGLLQLSVVNLPFTGAILDVGEHGWGETLLIFTLALAPVSLIEIFKWVRGRSGDGSDRKPMAELAPSR